MAVRPVFYVSNHRVVSRDIAFNWYSGFAKSQKQKSICSLHEEIVKTDPSLHPLEISTKSENEIGYALSAFHLILDGTHLENVFQSSKVFEHGGPYQDLLDADPRKAKHDERLNHSGKLNGFFYGGEMFPLIPKTVFYDFIYLKAVLVSGIPYEKIREYNGFTDIEFNPQRSINTQARASAEIKLMLEEDCNLKELSSDKEKFIQWHKQYVRC